MSEVPLTTSQVRITTDLSSSYPSSKFRCCLEGVGKRRGREGKKNTHLQSATSNSDISMHFAHLHTTPKQALQSKVTSGEGTKLTNKPQNLSGKCDPVTHPNSLLFLSALDCSNTVFQFVVVLPGLSKYKSPQVAGINLKRSKGSSSAMMYFWTFQMKQLLHTGINEASQHHPVLCCFLCWKTTIFQLQRWHRAARAWLTSSNPPLADSE